ncbi:hypothetical protein ACH5RR_022918 [Cinchona calisaya]|uniref:F-box associated beta-propeller type 1 domain-containing protein n=1 Tax=Cinchona calisaya TaxID=153742 RepID=A0ABD2Z961_9GENT
MAVLLNLVVDYSSSPIVSGPYAAICGFYFHSLTNQFKLLFRRRPHSSDLCEYFIYSLGDVTFRKIDSSTHQFWPSYYDNPVVLNGALHWITDFHAGIDVSLLPSCSNIILVFRMDTEVFSTFPHPERICPSPYNSVFRRLACHGNIRSLVKDEKYLSYVSLDCLVKIMYIWILEDYSNWDWVRERKVCLYLVDKHINHVNLNERIRPGQLRIDVLKYENGQLWLDCKIRGLFVFNLDQKSSTKLGIPSPFFSNANHISFPLTKSLVPVG